MISKIKKDEQDRMHRLRQHGKPRKISCQETKERKNEYRQNRSLGLFDIETEVRKMDHFTEDNSKSPLSIAIMILMFPLVGVSMWIFYEYWGEPKYWKNRWRLHRLFKKGKVKLKSAQNGFGISICRYVIDIEGQEYRLDIWNGKEMTLCKENFTISHGNYIGLFKGSLITKWLNKKAIKSIIEISDIQGTRDRKLKKLGI